VLALVALIVAVAVTGSLLPSRVIDPTRARIASLYLPMIATEWALAFYCAWFVPRVRRIRFVRGDVVVAVVLVAIVVAIESVFSSATGSVRSASIMALLPRMIGEHVVWIAVALSAGICEEIVYRGYFQSQLAAMTRSTFAGIALQAVLFGIAHASQGWSSMLRFAFYGALFGIVAGARRSLAPTILAHTMIDLAGGFLR
jgi:membrane protease YdiL (CAAX protease family)